VRQHLHALYHVQQVAIVPLELEIQMEVEIMLLYHAKLELIIHQQDYHLQQHALLVLQDITVLKAAHLVPHINVVRDIVVTRTQPQQYVHKNVFLVTIVQLDLCVLMLGSLQMLLHSCVEIIIIIALLGSQLHLWSPQGTTVLEETQVLEQMSKYVIKDIIVFRVFVIPVQLGHMVPQLVSVHLVPVWIALQDTIVVLPAHQQLIYLVLLQQFLHIFGPPTIVLQEQ
jgi:hypothetical protein